jgi:hypothetical protein
MEIWKKLRWRGSRSKYLGDLVGKQLHDNAAGRRAADGDVEEDVGVGHFDRIGDVGVLVEESVAGCWERWWGRSFMERR